MKKFLTRSFLALVLFQTTAESTNISGEEYEQIEHRVSEFTEYYWECSQDPQFAPLRGLSRIFDIRRSAHSILLNNDNTRLTNPGLMFVFIQGTARQLINSPTYKNFDDESPVYRRLHALVERLDPICRHFKGLADRHP